MRAARQALCPPGLSLGRSALRADSAAVLGLGSRRETRCVHCVHYAQTVATSQSTKRASRADPNLRSSPPHISPRRAAPGARQLWCQLQQVPLTVQQRRVRAGQGRAWRAERTRTVRWAVLAWRGRPLARRGLQGRAAQTRGRAQRVSLTDSPRLSERSERRERSEFRGGRETEQASPDAAVPVDRLRLASGLLARAGAACKDQGSRRNAPTASVKRPACPGPPLPRRRGMHWPTAPREGSLVQLHAADRLNHADPPSSSSASPRGRARALRSSASATRHRRSTSASASAPSSRPAH